MSVHLRKINPAGGPVEIELVAGNMHVFSYKCVLMKKDGSSQQIVLRGTTIDTLPDKLILPFPAGQLADLFVAMDGLLSPITVTGKDQPYAIEIHVRQDGAEVGGGPVVINGTLKSTIPILEHVEL